MPYQNQMRHDTVEWDNEGKDSQEEDLLTQLPALMGQSHIPEVMTLLIEADTPYSLFCEICCHHAYVAWIYMLCWDQKRER